MVSRLILFSEEMALTVNAETQCTVDVVGGKTCKALHFWLRKFEAK